MLVLVLVGGLLLAVFLMIGKIFVPRRMHVGYDRAVSGLFLNMLRISILGFVLIGIYTVLIAYGVVS